MTLVRIRPGLVLVEDFLGQGLGLQYDRPAAATEKLIHGDPADHFAQGTFRGLLQGVVRITHLEQVVLRIPHLVLHGQLDLDDILVLGQHLGPVTDGTQPVHIYLSNGFKTAQVPVRSRPGNLVEFAEAQLHAAFGRIDDIDT